MPSKTSGRKSRNCGTQTGDGIAVTTSREKGIQVGTYPDLREKAEATKQREKMDMFPKVSLPTNVIVKYFDRVSSSFFGTFDGNFW